MSQSSCGSTHDMPSTARLLQDHVDWDRYFDLIAAIGDSLNALKDRFDKSDLLEQAIELYSGGSIRWINQTGSDHLLPNGQTMEMKHMDGCIMGARGKMRRTIPQIKLMNSLGTCNHSCLPSNYADFLLLSDSNAVGIVDQKDIIPHVRATGDGLCADGVPMSKVMIVATRRMLNMGTETQFDYKIAKREMQQRYIKQIQVRNHDSI